MSEENVKAAQLFVDAVNEGDHDAALRLVHSDVVFEPQRAALFDGAFIGRDGVKRFLTDTAETFELFRVEGEIRDIGDGRVVGIGTIRVRGRSSGIEADIPTAAIAEYRDGLLWRYKDYGTADKALEAAGLSE